jgi:zinc transport system substrate-binding protein
MSRLPLLFSVLLTALLAAPGAPGQEVAPEFRVLCSTFPVHQFVRNVTAGCEGVSVELMLPADLGCPHDYTLTPEDMRKLSAADVLVINGLGLEEFLGDPLKKANPGLVVLDSSLGMGELIREEGGEACELDHAHDHDHSHDHDNVNPHVFASPVMAAGQVQRIAEGLAKADPARAAAYGRNGRAYADRLRKLHAEVVAAGAALANRRILTPHGAFDYFARDAGLEIVARIQAHPGQEPSASEMLGLVRTARDTSAGAVIDEPQYPGKTGATIAREAGIPVVTLDPVATGPADAAPDYYETTMRANMQALGATLGTR